MTKIRAKLRKERLLALAKVIEQQPHVIGPAPGGFSMAAFFHPCGAPSDIAGFAALLSCKGVLPPDFASGWDAMKLARDYLGLDAYEAEILFRPNERVIGETWLTITPAQAAQTLRHLAETGSVDWLRFNRVAA